MTDNALVALQGIDNLPVANVSVDQFDELSKSTDYLGRLQLFTKGKLVNQRKIGPGEYGIPSGEEVEVLGDKVDLLILARRAKAIDLSDREAIVVNYDPASDTFKDIAARSGVQDSGCMYGVSFLVYERTTGRFLEFYCGTKSARPVAGKIYPFMALTQGQIDALEEQGKDVSELEPHGPKPLTLTSRLIEKGSYSWHVPVVLPSSTAFEDLPAVEKIAEQITRFLAPEDNGVEKVTEEEASNRRAR